MTNTDTVGSTGRALHETHLPVAEIFGPTFQGEGPHTGRVCSFVRLGLCNLACVFCDTPYTWDRARFDVGAECPEQNVTAVCDQVAGHNTPLTVITGGEPLIHQGRVAFIELLNRLAQHGGIHVETNGTIPPTEHTRERVEHFTVSPKLSNNGADPCNKRVKPCVLRAFVELAMAGRANFKFVVSDHGDLAEVDHLVAEHQLPRSAVWIMPEGRTGDEILAKQATLADAVLKCGLNMTTRMHVLIWGDRRGV
ncbi:7-carboxy-7-deazaguanine synthase QueE [Saccharopolyspora sp. ASAGF58]|uniref:7-carboxy-7-deazaguanine synthase QueE n=1 Tax=Saccharopolyspora sp. ASAGF58 TaxID=2719023 RepID=UPI00143FEE95|nr:7-carboxy-7-deazaguanine synthase QueE [Saccharopolyspora sp. ASAGF58]QIZ37937.1 7-carboxy-7-deazaguanine synthase QueE [Saccharopolyspora sp. ASAGF58]